MASKGRDWWRQQQRDRTALFIASPSEPSIPKDLAERRVAAARNCADEGMKAGTKAGAVAFVLTAIPTIVGARTIPWAKANLNYTAQALIISAASLATYFIVSDKTILECARVTSYEKIQAERAAAHRDV